MRTTLTVLVLLAGCFKPDAEPLPVETLDFAPAAGAPAGWVVQGFDLPIECPDKQPSAFYLVYPEDPGEAALPVAVLYHSGAFDYVRDPPADDPLAGVHYQDPSRLDRAWALRRAFTTLGQYDDGDRFEQHTGAMAAALVEAGVVVLVPANCWGDRWHNYQGYNENDYAADLFHRNGGAAADWAWRIASEPSFSEANGISLPVSLDPDRVFLVGQGEGGRAVGEVLAAGSRPAGVVTDSVVDDLRVYYDEPDLYSEIVTGLDRIFPEGRDSTPEGAFGWAPWLPARTVYVYSSLDSQIPMGAHDRILNRLSSKPDAWVYDASVQAHVVTGADLDLARQVVDYLLAP